MLTQLLSLACLLDPLRPLRGLLSHKVEGSIPRLRAFVCGVCTFSTASQQLCKLLPPHKDFLARPTASLNCLWCRRCQCDWLSVLLCGRAINCRLVQLVLHHCRQTAGINSDSVERKQMDGWTTHNALFFPADKKKICFPGCPAEVNPTSSLFGRGGCVMRANGC